MKLSTDSADFSGALAKRYGYAMRRYFDTTNALTNGTKTGLTTSGVTGPEAKRAPTSSIGMTRCIDDLAHRLEHLAFAPRPEGGPPLEAYTTATTEHGEVYSATAEQRAFMRSRYPGYGVGNHSEVSAPCSTAQGAGGTKRSRFKQHSPLDTGA